MLRGIGRVLNKIYGAHITHVIMPSVEISFAQPITANDVDAVRLAVNQRLQHAPLEIELDGNRTFTVNFISV